MVKAYVKRDDRGRVTEELKVVNGLPLVHSYTYEGNQTHKSVRPYSEVMDGGRLETTKAEGGYVVRRYDYSKHKVKPVEEIYYNGSGEKQRGFTHYYDGNRKPVKTEVTDYNKSTLTTRTFKNDASKYEVKLHTGQTIKTSSLDYVKRLMRGESPISKSQKPYYTVTYKGKTYITPDKDFKPLQYKYDSYSLALQNVENRKARADQQAILDKLVSRIDKKYVEAWEKEAKRTKPPEWLQDQAQESFSKNPAAKVIEYKGVEGKDWTFTRGTERRQASGMISAVDPAAPKTVSFDKYLDDLEKKESPLRGRFSQKSRDELKTYEELSARAGPLRPYSDVAVGAAAGAFGIAEMVIHPVKTVKGVVATVINPRSAGYSFGEYINTKGLPYAAGEMFTYAVVAGQAGKVFSKLKVTPKARAYARIEQDLKNIQKKQSVAYGEFKLVRTAKAEKSMIYTDSIKTYFNEASKPKGSAWRGFIETEATKTRVWISKNKITQIVTDKVNPRATYKFSYDRISNVVDVTRTYKGRLRNRVNKFSYTPENKPVKEFGLEEGKRSKNIYFEQQAKSIKKVTGVEGEARTLINNDYFMAEYYTAIKQFSRIKNPFMIKKKRISIRDDLRPTRSGRIYQYDVKKITTRIYEGNPLKKADKVTYFRKVQWNERVKIRQPRTEVNIDSSTSATIRYTNVIESTLSEDRLLSLSKNVVKGLSPEMKNLAANIEKSNAAAKTWAKEQARLAKAEAKASKAKSKPVKKITSGYNRATNLESVLRPKDSGKVVNVFVEDAAKKVNTVSEIEGGVSGILEAGAVKVLPIKVNSMPKPLPVFKMGSVSFSESNIKQSQISEMKPISKSIIKQVQRQDSKVRQDQRVGLDSKLESVQVQNIMSDQYIIQKANQKVTQEVSQKQLQKQMTKLSMATAGAASLSEVGAPKTIFTNVTPVIVTPPIRPFKFSEKLGGDSFGVEVRRRGVFKSVGFGMEFEEAVKRGGQIVKDSAAASFRITGESNKNPFDFLDKSIFRRGKKDKNVFVQRRSKRISSGGELAEITFKGLASIKKKKKVWGWL